MKTDYRNLSDKEIDVLIKNGSSAENWNLIKVKSDFNPNNVKNVVFSGENYLGVFSKIHLLKNEKPRMSGVYNAFIHNCVIEDDVFINGVIIQISNYFIDKNVIIENVDNISVNEKTSFGNGVRVAVLNEAGGREVAIYDEISSHTAYLMAFYRHRPKLIEELYNFADKYANEKTSSVGHIGKGAYLKNCQIIENVNIGEKAKLESVYKLKNGTVNSSSEDNTYVGVGVIAENFIFQSGSSIDEGSIVTDSLIGEGTKIGKQYSVTNSLFFANCQGFHGEACSVFAGPFTATHHKSTLLIAGYFSFFNAGSGSNQSNHLYKLGPIHQGIVQRGSKTTSDSYVMWPAKIGAFSLIVGRHLNNPDTSDYPYSYLIENNGETILIPGINLRSVGTIRDARKWSKRDLRKSEKQLDQITYNLLNPYSVQKMIKGLSILKQSGGENYDFYLEGFTIKSSSVSRGIKLYEMTISKFLGSGLVKKLEVNDFSNLSDVRKILTPSVDMQSSDEWIDMAGLVVPAKIVAEFIEEVEKGVSVDFNSEYVNWKESYFDMLWSWSVEKLIEIEKFDYKTASADDYIEYIQKWIDAVVGLDSMLYEDAKKEFALKSQIGFGIDVSHSEKQKDFENVRGDFESHPDVITIVEHIAQKQKMANLVIEKLKKINI